jgi:uncharacterized protein (TIRG00374 family)
MLGFAANVVLPGRLGEPLRVAAIHKLGKVEVSLGVSSVVLERILDLAALGLMLGLGTLVIGRSSESLALLRTIGAAVTVVTLAIPPVLFLLLGRHPETLQGRLKRLTDYLPRPIQEKALKFLIGLGRGFAVVDSLPRLAAIFLVSLIHWMLAALSIWAVARSLGLGLSVAGGAIVLGSVAFATALPQAPGFVGTYHWATAETLGLLGQPTEPAAACAILMWLAAVLPTFLLGLVSLAWVGRGETREMLGESATLPTTEEGCEFHE